MPQRARHDRQRGLSLVEVMVVVAILGIMVGGATLGFRSVQRAQFRGTAGKLSGAIRYLYNRSVGTGAYYRLVFDLEANSYRAEKSDERFLMSRAKERSAADVEEKAKREEEEARREEEGWKGTSGIAAQLAPPPRPKKAHFQAFQDAMLPTVELKGGIKIRDVYTPRQSEAFTEGKAYLYFFPDGHTERALIHLQRGEDDAEDAEIITLFVHPLTGRVEVKNGDIDPPSDFDYADDEGNR